MDEDKIVEQRGKKLLNFFKKDSDKIFLAIIIFAIILRLVYFFMTLDQPLWWDEADYLSMSKVWAFGGEYGFFGAVRPVLFSLIVAGFFKIAFSEFLPRLLILILSIFSVIGVYYLGKELANRKVALIASLFMSVFSLNLFFTYRLLVDIPSLTFFIFPAIYFFRYLKTRSHKALYIGAALMAVGTLFKLTTATFLFAFLIFLIFTERFALLKRKELWISGIIFLLIMSPYFLWGYVKFGGFVLTQAAAFNAPESNYFANGFTNLKAYFLGFPSHLSWVLLVFFIIGLFICLSKIILGFDILMKNKSLDLRKNFYLFLIFLIPILFVSFSMGYIEERYILNAFPAIFILTSIAILKVYNVIKKNQKIVAILFLILLLGYSVNFQMAAADASIKGRLHSYEEVKLAGLWMEENLDDNAIIFARSIPMISYYSSNKAVDIPSIESDFEAKIEEFRLNESISGSFLMVSLFEPHEQWMFEYAQKNNLNVAQAYFRDAQKTQPSLIIYDLN